MKPSKTNNKLRNYQVQWSGPMGVIIETTIIRATTDARAIKAADKAATKFDVVGATHQIHQGKRCVESWDECEKRKLK